MAIVGQVGERFHLYDSPYGPYGHFATILTPPDTNGLVVFVNFTKKDPDGENLIWFYPGDMDFINAPTTIAYGYGEKATLQSLNQRAEKCPGNVPGHFISDIVYHAFRSFVMNTGIQRMLKTCYPAIYQKYITDYPENPIC